MDPKLFSIIERVDAFSPELGRRMLGTFLRVASPFNAPLHAQIDEWSPTLCRVRVPQRRSLRNHLGGVHAGALATAGETPAGLLIIKSFPFSRYRLILKDLQASYRRQARGAMVAEARIDPASLQQAREGMARGEPQMLVVETRILEPGGELLASVTTQWQVKPWEQVQLRS